jgi:hypothetical protein
MANSIVKGINILRRIEGHFCSENEDRKIIRHKIIFMVENE